MAWSVGKCEKDLRWWKLAGEEIVGTEIEGTNRDGVVVEKTALEVENGWDIGFETTLDVRLDKTERKVRGKCEEQRGGDGRLETDGKHSEGLGN
jgi:hypothetical protein